mmetsp:Transcript_29430/g.50177  ORF Transcript_29430/g.50177 Transcript_29430/m.50177 type:complete len:277 (+) Transcript_29430:569-1399(+)
MESDVGHCSLVNWRGSTMVILAVVVVMMEIKVGGIVEIMTIEEEATTVTTMVVIPLVIILCKEMEDTTITTTAGTADRMRNSVHTTTMSIMGSNLVVTMTAIKGGMWSSQTLIIQEMHSTTMVVIKGRRNTTIMIMGGTNMSNSQEIISEEIMHRNTLQTKLLVITIDEEEVIHFAPIIIATDFDHRMVMILMDFMQKKMTRTMTSNSRMVLTTMTGMETMMVEQEWSNLEDLMEIKAWSKTTIENNFLIRMAQSTILVMNQLLPLISVTMLSKLD